MNNVHEVIKWSYNTIAFVNASNIHKLNKDEINKIIKDSVVHDMIDDDMKIVSPNLEVMITRTLDIAKDTIDESIACDEPRDDIDEDQTRTVMSWIIRSMGLVKEVKSAVYDRRMLLREADEQIIRPVQGNRQSPPTIADLDLVVQRAIKVMNNQLQDVA